MSDFNQENFQEYYHSFENNTGQSKDWYEPLYSSLYMLNSTPNLIQQEWLCYYITYEGWYAIKQRNQTKANKTEEKHVFTTSLMTLFRLRECYSYSISWAWIAQRSL